jgi:hypothetical protein
MARETGGMARVVSGVVGNFSVRKSDRPDDECAEQASDKRREGVGPGKSAGSGDLSGGDEMRWHGLGPLRLRWRHFYLIGAAERQGCSAGRLACLDRSALEKTRMGRGVVAMTGETRFRVPGIRLSSLLIGLTGAALVAGCSDLKKAMGFEKTSPDEFAVESRAPLTMPPDFDLRPPQPGAARPQEKSSGQQARQTIEQAGPGEPGKQAPDFRLRRAEDGLPDVGAPSGQSPDPNAIVGDKSLANKLLDYQPSTGAQSPPAEKRETNPLQGVY